MAQATILVVDDEQEICELTRSFLTKHNYRVFTANSQDEALNIVNKERPQIILLDMRLGPDSGIDVLRKIRQIDMAIKVIMVTGMDDEKSIIEAKAEGADDYIIKPFTAGFLRDIIAEKAAKLANNGGNKHG